MMADDRRGAEDAGYKDQRMVQAAKDKQPITDAMMQELSLDDGADDPIWDDLIRGFELEIKFGGGGLKAYIEIHDGSVDLCGYGVQVRSPEGPGGGGDDGIDTYEADVADMAAALRLAANALSPDPTRRALEIAARLGMYITGFDDVDADMRTWLLVSKDRFWRTVLSPLVYPDTDFDCWGADGFRQVRMEIGNLEPLLVVGGAVAHWLQQAREFFEQAEEEARDDPT